MSGFSFSNSGINVFVKYFFKLSCSPTSLHVILICVFPSVLPSTDCESLPLEHPINKKGMHNRIKNTFF